jgi:hypothetical protein
VVDAVGSEVVLFKPGDEVFLPAPRNVLDQPYSLMGDDVHPLAFSNKDTDAQNLFAP